MEKQLPLFSICIPTYMDAEALSRAIGSLLMQTCLDFECLVSDDSPGNSIRDIVQKFNDPRIFYIQNKPSLGAPVNWNAVLRMARGKIVTLLHQDDWYSSPETLSRVRLAHCCNGIVVCGRNVWRNGSCIGTYITAQQHADNFLHDYPQRSLVVNRLGHPSVVFFDAALKDIIFDEKLCYFLDTDWYARLWRGAHGRIAYIGEPLISMELGRAGQLSGQCVEDISKVLSELKYILHAERATSAQRLQAIARLAVSHVRHLTRSDYRVILGQLRQHTLWEKGYLVAFCLCLATHMIYRLFRKKLGLQAWG